MNKQEFLGKLDSYEFPTYQYVIVAGGAMLLHGLRKETADINIAVSEPLAKELHLDSMIPTDKGTYQYDNDLEISISISDIDKEELEGHLVQTLPSLLRAKRRLNRPKDQKDIEILIDYFTHQSRS